MATRVRALDPEHRPNHRRRRYSVDWDSNGLIDWDQSGEYSTHRRGCSRACFWHHGEDGALNHALVEHRRRKPGWWSGCISYDLSPFVPAIPLLTARFTDHLYLDTTPLASLFHLVTVAQAVDC
jgi:hypothetical protein